MALKVRRNALVGLLTITTLVIYLRTYAYRYSRITRNPTKHAESLFTVYDPHQNADRLIARLRTKCEITMPNKSTIAAHRDWGVRLVSYHNIDKYLRDRWSNIQQQSQLKVLGNERFLTPYEEMLNISIEKVDLHHIPYAEESVDVIAADQVLEHVIFPQLAMLEMHRVLKVGGIAILTTITYNPVHEDKDWHDYWRFTLDGLLTLSLPFRNVPLCGSWGNADAIAARAKSGLGSNLEGATLERNAAFNEMNNPFVVWMIVEK